MTQRKTKYRARVLIPAAGLCLTAALAAPGHAAAAAPADAEHRGKRTSSPVGKWTGTVQHGQGSGSVTLSFHSNGVMCLFSGGGPAGGGEGAGYWQRTGPHAFSYRVLERLYQSNGTTVGYVDVDQNATQTGAAFNSTGISDVFDANGGFLVSAQATVSVSRVSTTPVAC